MISLLFASLIVIFYHRTNFDFNLACSYEGDKEFLPDAYVVIHSDKDFEQYSKIDTSTAKIGNKCKSSLDFVKHDHVIVYGRKNHVLQF